MTDGFVCEGCDRVIYDPRQAPLCLRCRSAPPRMSWRPIVNGLAVLAFVAALVLLGAWWIAGAP